MFSLFDWLLSEKINEVVLSKKYYLLLRMRSYLLNPLSKYYLLRNVILWTQSNNFWYFLNFLKSLFLEIHIRTRPDHGSDGLSYPMVLIQKKLGFGFKNFGPINNRVFFNARIINGPDSSHTKNIWSGPK